LKLLNTGRLYLATKRRYLCAEIACWIKQFGFGLWIVVLEVDSELDPNDDISAVQ
jgi:hypothetical protein